MISEVRNEYVAMGGTSKVKTDVFIYVILSLSNFLKEPQINSFAVVQEKKKDLTSL